MTLKRMLRRMIRQMGWDVTPFRPQEAEFARLMRMLVTHRVNLVLDVGANTGQFAKDLRDAGYAGRIISFEPLTDAHGRLVANARGDALWTVAPRMAIGDHEGVAEIHVSRNSLSSSILPMLQAHLEAEPGSDYVATETVPMGTMDRAVTQYLRPTDVPFLKLDVQGYESAVLDGAVSTLQRSVGVQIELSLVPLYQGQDLWLPMIQRLEGLGFQLWSLSPGFMSEQTGRLLECDAVMFRGKELVGVPAR
jgi:FkbM family methyltransferase